MDVLLTLFTVKKLSVKSAQNASFHFIACVDEVTIHTPQTTLTKTRHRLVAALATAHPKVLLFLPDIIAF